MEKIIERYGSLKKIEPLRLIQDDAVLKNTLAYECPEPFPGYYSSHKSQTIPLYVYLVIDDYMHMDDFLDMKERVLEAYGEHFHSTLATITFFDETYHAIRVRRVEDYRKIRIIQELFILEGVRFHRFTRRYKYVERALIRIKKFFRLEELEEGFYLDKVDAFFGYFSIDYHPGLEQFEKTAKQVALNVDIIDYDAAVAYYYENFKVHEMVRIYTGDVSLDLLKKLKREYSSQFVKFEK
ncbi:MAG: hypothetical protein PF489_06120 [Salinivirgaceae bacterium]|jgi:hypothetical protein|nr:hypothetical protein [Salinivirgaceae bacterium]